ncbi:MAG: hypothetical protein JRN12_07315 [Nitrososphaerota archaeon]|nr:hypothetical protein [Nitrososphaerota archaeon]MDG6951632.1 hypothetical protein [Nitrososphaerota archaeon]
MQGVLLDGADGVTRANGFGFIYSGRSSSGTMDAKMYSMSYLQACHLAAYIRRTAPGVEAIVLKTDERDPVFSPGVRG